MGPTTLAGRYCGPPAQYQARDARRVQRAAVVAHHRVARAGHDRHRGPLPRYRRGLPAELPDRARHQEQPGQRQQTAGRRDSRTRPPLSGLQDDA